MCDAISTNTSSAGDPGLSLWLVPPEDSDIYNALANAITHILPPILNSSSSVPWFEPHLTLTSRIPRHLITVDAQQWLDKMELPAIPTVEVKFHELAVGDAFTKKLFIRCERSDSLLQLASSYRVFSSAKVDEAQYDPHVSIV